VAIDKPLQIAVVGFGAAAQAIIPAIQANSSFLLVAVVEPHPEVQKAARLLGVPVFHDIIETQNNLSARWRLPGNAYPTAFTTSHRLFRKRLACFS